METPRQNQSWKDQFRATHDLEAIPSPELRKMFSIFLRLRNGTRSYFTQVPADDWDKTIGEKGDSPKKQIIHKIGNTILRARGLTTGKLNNWRYENTDPDDFKELQDSDKNQLIERLDKSTEILYESLKNNEIKSEISIYGETFTTQDYFLWVLLHESLSEGIAIGGMGDVLDLERKSEVKEVWG